LDLFSIYWNKSAEISGSVKSGAAQPGFESCQGQQFVSLLLNPVWLYCSPTGTGGYLSGKFDRDINLKIHLNLVRNYRMCGSLLHVPNTPSYCSF